MWWVKVLVWALLFLHPVLLRLLRTKMTKKVVLVRNLSMIFIWFLLLLLFSIYLFSYFLKWECDGWRLYYEKRSCLWLLSLFFSFASRTPQRSRRAEEVTGAGTSCLRMCSFIHLFYYYHSFTIIKLHKD